MKKSKFLVITTFLLILFLVPTKASAQEDFITERTFSVIVETDSEEPLSDVGVVCRSITHDFDSGDNSETLETQVTDENGIIEVVIDDTPNTSYRCATESTTTDDGCWYFARKSKFFSYRDPLAPIYIVGLESPETCNKDLSEQEVDAHVEELFANEPPAFKNSHVQEVTHYPQEKNNGQGNQMEEADSATGGKMSKDTQDGAENASNIFEWVFSKIKSLFRK